MIESINKADILIQCIASFVEYMESFYGPGAAGYRIKRVIEKIHIKPKTLDSISGIMSWINYDNSIAFPLLSCISKLGLTDKEVIMVVDKLLDIHSARGYRGFFSRGIDYIHACEESASHMTLSIRGSYESCIENKKQNNHGFRVIFIPQKFQEISDISFFLSNFDIHSSHRSASNFLNLDVVSEDGIVTLALNAQEAIRRIPASRITPSFVNKFYRSHRTRNGLSLADIVDKISSQEVIEIIKKNEASYLIHTHVHLLDLNDLAQLVINGEMSFDDVFIKIERERKREFSVLALDFMHEDQPKEAISIIAQKSASSAKIEYATHVMAHFGIDKCAEIARSQAEIYALIDIFGGEASMKKLKLSNTSKRYALGSDLSL